ncbi:ABC transporter permease [Massilia litorea]|uniref:Transport permease protein n=1 Tax=Massilia litorea TaxID=2769491 RepID=A0A7L9U641_9BURK|nr:ABC transporter permease [Massilia litorea]QOL50407.1 ABC transporter permease [Massilia litorea]
MNNRPTASALLDIVAATKRISLVGVLGWQDVRARYRRSALGPFWITLSMGVVIATIGIVFGQIFKSPMQEFLPFLTIGLILWAFISNIITEGATGFITAENIIKQLPIPMFVHIMRMIWRNLLILLHNLVIFPIVLLVFGKTLGWVALLSIPGLALGVLNLSWIALLLAIVCARYRDLPQMVTSVLQVVFYLTPVMWLPKLLPQRAGMYLLDLNPVYHLLEIIRAPLLGQAPSVTNWVVAGALAVVGWIVALFVFGRYRRRIAYWL